MKRKTRKKIRYISRGALALGAGTVLILGLKSCFSEDDNVIYNKNINSLTNSSSNQKYNMISLDDAISSGIVSVVNFHDLKESVINNENLDDEMSSKILDYVQKLHDNFPEFNNAVLNKNLALLDVEEITHNEMVDKFGESEKNVKFSALDNKLYCVKSANIDSDLYVEITHMLNNLIIQSGNVLTKVGFSDNQFGVGIEEYLCRTFAGMLGYEVNNSHDDYVFLLNDVVGSNVLFNSLLNGTIYNITDSLEDISLDTNADYLIDYMDSEVINKVDNSDSIYSLVGDYFVCKESSGLKEDFVSYLPTYISHCSVFQSKLDEYGVSSNVISKFKEKRGDVLASITRDTYGSNVQKDAIILDKDPNGMNAILSNVGSEDINIYNFEENEYGVDYISYIGLKDDDASDGIFDLLSGEMVSPDDIWAAESGQYYVEHEGFGEANRLSVVHK